MNLTTDLPIAHLGFAHWHTDDTEVGIVVAKAAFRLTAEGAQPHIPPPDLALVDTFEGNPATTSLATEQDIAPGKPKTDLIIRAIARSFQNEPRRDWPVSIRIPDVLSYGFHVRGPAMWHKQLGRWKLGQPDLVSSVPLKYLLAYGGSYTHGETTHFFEQNFAGKGFMTEEAAPRDGWQAPQIGLLAEFIAARPFVPMTVCGTMPIAKAWLPRRSRAGTFDEKWKRDRHPRMPLDYDLGFWNAAPLRLQLAHLQGGEVIMISGVSHRREIVNLRLPGARLALQSDAGEVTPMVLDTIDIDLQAVDDGAVTLTMVWRVLLPDRNAYRHAAIVKG